MARAQELPQQLPQVIRNEYSRRYLFYYRHLCPPLAGPLIQQSPRHLIDNTAGSSPAGFNADFNAMLNLTLEQPILLLGSKEIKPLARIIEQQCLPCLLLQTHWYPFPGQLFSVSFL